MPDAAPVIMTGLPVMGLRVPAMCAPYRGGLPLIRVRKRGPPSQRYAGVPDYGTPSTMLLGGLRELIATTVEDGGDIGDITEVAVQATQAMLGPRALPAPAR